jgi:hypothetical protein
MLAYMADRRLRSRYFFGEKELQKSLPNGCPITEAQKKEINEFWQPFLFNKYAKKSFDIRWFDVYNRTNVFGFDLKNYIPDGYYYRIVDPFFSDVAKSKVIDDKNLYDLFFYDAPQPQTIGRKINGMYMDDGYHLISEEVLLNKCVDRGRVIIKVSVNSEAGAGVHVWDEKKSDRNELRSIFSKEKNIVVQEFINQHELLASFCNSCVNTLRLITLLFENEVYVVSSVVIMGGKDAKTNHLHSGGVVCGIKPNGQLLNTAFDGKLNRYDTHPNGVAFSSVTIPNYDKCVSLVKDLSPRFAGISRFIGWDLTIDEKGNPVIIEANLNFAGSVQIAAGPVFGDMTKPVLEYVKKHFVV